MYYKKMLTLQHRKSNTRYEVKMGLDQEYLSKK